MAILYLSPIRHLFTLETLFSILPQSYLPESDSSPRVGSNNTVYSEIGGFDAASIISANPENLIAIRVIALRTSDSLYLWVVMADAHQWELTEQDVFDAILATLQYAD